MTGTEAVENGFADELIEEKEVAASVGGFFMSKYRNLPQNLIPHIETEEEPPAEKPEAATADENLLKLYNQKLTNNLRRYSHDT
jgi:hypothetical protein